MKKLSLIILSIIMIIGLVGCSDKSTGSTEIQIDYGNSSIYSKEDMDSAIKQIKKEFDSWKGFEHKTLRYYSDEECNSENIKWLNQIEVKDKKEPFTQCIVFESSFHTPQKSTEGFEGNQDYSGWKWWLARSEGSEWVLVTWGY